MVGTGIKEKIVEPVGIKRSQFVELAIYVDRKPWRGECGFDNWCYLRDAYDNPSKKIVFLCSRQIGKSTTLGNILLTETILSEGTRCLYVSSSNDKAVAFGKDRIRAVIEYSPGLVNLFKAPLGVRDFECKNSSIIRVRTAFVRGDQLRTYTGQVLCIDEAQEIPEDAFFVIEACTFMFPTEFKIFISGTPLTYSNYLSQLYYQYSTMCEWMTKCDSCGHWNRPNIDMIGELGPVCTKCGKQIDVRKGEWVRGRTSAEYEGYHYNQILNPKYAFNQDAWQELRAKMKRWPASKFFNEVLGEPYDQGTSVLAMDEVRAACADYDPIPPEKLQSNMLTFAGIDWGTGEKSFTVLVILAWAGMTFDVIFAKRYSGMEARPDIALADIANLVKKYRCQMVGADWGFGFKWNYDLMRAIGPDRVIPIAYARTLKEKMKWDGKGYKFIANRNMVMSDTFDLIKQKKIRFYRASKFMDEFAGDLLSVFIEDVGRGESKLKYSRTVGSTDDFTHALTYAIIAAQTKVPIPEIYFAPSWP